MRQLPWDRVKGAVYLFRGPQSKQLCLLFADIHSWNEMLYVWLGPFSSIIALITLKCVDMISSKDSNCNKEIKLYVNSVATHSLIHRS